MLNIPADTKVPTREPQALSGWKLVPAFASHSVCPVGRVLPVLSALTWACIPSSSLPLSNVRCVRCLPSPKAYLENTPMPLGVSAAAWVGAVCIYQVLGFIHLPAVHKPGAEAHTPVNPAFGKLRQENQMVKVSLSCIMKYNWAHETFYQMQENPTSFKVRRVNERDSMNA